MRCEILQLTLRFLGLASFPPICLPSFLETIPKKIKATRYVNGTAQPRLQCICTHMYMYTYMYRVIIRSLTINSIQSIQFNRIQSNLDLVCPSLAPEIGSISRRESIHVRIHISWPPTVSPNELCLREKNMF